MSDTTPPVAPPAAVASIHQAIRRGSVLKSAPKPVEGVLPASTVTAYQQRVDAEKNEASVLKELQAKRNSIQLKSVPLPQTSTTQARIAADYLKEQEEEAEILTQNSKILHQLRKENEDEPPPPPPPTEDPDAIPPPPADFVASLTNPKLKLNLTPVVTTRAQHDGLNPALITLAQIEKKDLRQTLRPVPPPIEKNHFATPEYQQEAEAEEAELNAHLRRNSNLLDQLKTLEPPPYPETEADLAEAAEAKRREEELLVKTAIPEQSEGAIEPQVQRARRNSKLSYLSDLAKPLVRLNLKPVPLPAIRSVSPSFSSSPQADLAPLAASHAVSTRERMAAATASLQQFCQRPPCARYMIGLMSGTSLDGVDAVIADFNPEYTQIRADGSGGHGRGRVIAHHFVPMPSELRATLLELNSPASPNQGELHQAAMVANQLSHLYAQTVTELLQKASVSSDTILAVANHGQTIRHRPECGYTLQLGNHALLAELLNLPVIGDFRSRDVAAGGTGAPLVPAFHQAFFGHGQATDMKSNNAGMIILNLGGIANISHITPDSQVLGFDTGPANVLIDLWIKHHRNLDYDADGAWSQSGQILPDLLDHLFSSEPYFTRAPPKSTGRDLFHWEWLQTKLKGFEAAKVEDVAATLTELTAISVARAIKQYCLASTTVAAAAVLGPPVDSPPTSTPSAIATDGGGGPLPADQVLQHAESREIGDHPTTTDRSVKSLPSLGRLSRNFINLYGRDSVKEIRLDDAAASLGVERRIIYDIVNVLQSVGIISRIGKNQFMWYGTTRLGEAIKILENAILATGKGFQPTNLMGGVLHPTNQPVQMAPPSKQILFHVVGSSVEVSEKPPIGDQSGPSLGHLSQMFIQMFLSNETRIVSVKDASRWLFGWPNPQTGETEEKALTAKLVARNHIRRLHDSANVLTALELIEKIRLVQTGQLAFKWVGAGVYPLISSLPNETYTKANDATTAAPDQPSRLFDGPSSSTITTGAVPTATKPVLLFQSPTTSSSSSAGSSVPIISPLPTSVQLTAPPPAPVYVCGGGALNSYLLTRLRHHLPTRLVSSTAEFGLAPMQVESMAFAWLGWEFLQGRTTNLPRVTGAKGKRILGVYYPA